MRLLLRPQPSLLLLHQASVDKKGLSCSVASACPESPRLGASGRNLDKLPCLAPCQTPHRAWEQRQAPHPCEPGELVPKVLLSARRSPSHHVPSSGDPAAASGTWDQTPGLVSGDGCSYKERPLSKLGCLSQRLEVGKFGVSVRSYHLHQREQENAGPCLGSP